LPWEHSPGRFGSFGPDQGDYSAVFAFHTFELLFNRQRHQPLYAAAQRGDFLDDRSSQVRVFFTVLMFFYDADHAQNLFDYIE